MHLEDRVAALEEVLDGTRRRSRWLAGALTVSCGVLVVLLLTAQSAPTQTAEELRTRRLVIVDDRDQQRAVLTVGVGGSLILFDEQGRGRVGLIANDLEGNGPELSFFAGDGQPVSLGTQYGLILRDPQGRNRAWLSAQSGLVLYDLSQRPTVGMRGVGADGGSFVKLWDPSGHARVELSLDNDVASVGLTDAAGRGRAVLLDGAGFALLDASGRVRAFMGAATQPNFTIYGAQGGIDWTAP